MTPVRKLLAIGAVAVTISGCSAFDRLTGGVDDTVLPGQREEAIPGRATFPERADPTVERAPEPLEPPPPQQDTSTACNPGDPGCEPPSGDDVFRDPQ